MRIFTTAVLAALTFGAMAWAASPTTRDIPVNGYIANNQVAQSGACQKICDGVKWNGQWSTTQQGQMSVCGTAYGDFNAGPIWNQADAQKKCPAIITLKFSGQWTNTPPQGTPYYGKNTAVCGCTGGTPFAN